MADVSAEPQKKKKDRSNKPEHLRRPMRRRVKKFGKRIMRRVALYQARQSLVPDAPFLETGLFPFLKEFEDRWHEMRDEAAEIVKLREHIPGFQDISPDQYRIATASNWKTFVLFGFGQRREKNCKQAPVTAEILSRVPHIQTAWFSILAPGYHIPAHTGVTKGILRAHLGLIIPKDREKCRIRVGDQIKAWESGKVIVLDDTYEHEVWNDTDEERVILLFDFDRPMGPLGRLLNNGFLRMLKLTSYYRDPLARMQGLEDRFEAAVRRADANLEALSDTEH
jgi:beta-hydroxylase